MIDIGIICLGSIITFLLTLRFNEHGSDADLLIGPIIVTLVVGTRRLLKSLPHLLAAPRRTAAMLTIWTTFVALVWIFGKQYEGDRLFPFQGNISDLSVSFTFEHFGFKSFFVYGVLPWIGFGVCYLLKENVNRPPKSSV